METGHRRITCLTHPGLWLVTLSTFPLTSTVFDKEYGATLWREGSNGLLLYLYLFSEHFYFTHQDMLGTSYMQGTFIVIENMTVNTKPLPQ